MILYTVFRLPVLTRYSLNGAAYSLIPGKEQFQLLIQLRIDPLLKPGLTGSPDRLIRSEPCNTAVFIFLFVKCFRVIRFKQIGHIQMMDKETLLSQLKAYKPWNEQ